jgi:hypothetical protein
MKLYYCTQVIDQNIPTTNFGWFNSSTDLREIRRTTLHEFGHVLGCIHEHQALLQIYLGTLIPLDVFILLH